MITRSRVITYCIVSLNSRAIKSVMIYPGPVLSLLGDDHAGVPHFLFVSGSSRPRLLVAARRRGASSTARRDETTSDRAAGARGRGVRGRERVRGSIPLARLR